MALCIPVRESGASDGAASSLQDAFLKFREGRQRCKRLASREPSGRSTAAKDALRARFVETAMSYLGIPYAKRFCEPGSAAYESPLFLDCCGLIRRVMDDLQEEFGFRLARWNQAYMFDTLPIALEPCQMRPGDLVFYTGTYVSPRARRQAHDMVHVEMWLGGDTGAATLGSRWRNGCVSVYESYRFEGKTFRDVTCHFRSIDTWLDGVCASVCPEHAWDEGVLKWEPGTKSVFAVGYDDGGTTQTRGGDATEGEAAECDEE